MGFRLRLQFPGCRTLKDRRSIVSSLVQGARSRHGFSAADFSEPIKVDYAEVALAAVGQSEAEIRLRLDRVVSTLDSAGEVEVLGIEEHRMAEGG